VNARGRFERGLPPGELWGVATENPRGKFDPRQPSRRSEAARARRRAKKIAKGRRMRLKAYLRSVTA